MLKLRKRSDYMMIFDSLLCDHHYEQWTDHSSLSGGKFELANQGAVSAKKNVFVSLFQSQVLIILIFKKKKSAAI